MDWFTHFVQDRGVSRDVAKDRNWDDCFKRMTFSNLKNIHPSVHPSIITSKGYQNIKTLREAWMSFLQMKVHSQFLNAPWPKYIYCNSAKFCVCLKVPFEWDMTRRPLKQKAKGFILIRCRSFQCRGATALLQALSMWQSSSSSL